MERVTDNPEKGWVVEDEPSASPIDSWASGAVAVRMRSPGYKALHKAIIDDAPSEVGSVAGSARTRRSGIKSSQSQRSGRTTRTAKTSGTRQGSRSRR